ncbi:heme ABC exporter ATP-binding protein CcmA [Salinisphaera sp. SPP-AMP-43]|uniref:heme ABC exporter ATP-binding protein CcmA n=1 Tax=Salinisphaera sp. SPP-AMP-43 TaxID=3121288 RepID=UPI003C6E19F7
MNFLVKQGSFDSDVAPAAGWLAIRGLGVQRGGRTLFSGIDRHLRPGSLLHVQGANGAGKTTFLETIAGLVLPPAGCVEWQAGRYASPIEEAPCYIGHDNALHAALTPIENLSWLMRLAGQPVATALLCDVLAELGLSRLRRRRCARLSAGQKRRVSLARLWVTEARLWLLDEPAAGLDTVARDQLAARVAAHAAAGGIVVYSTHEPLALGEVDVLDLDQC